MNIVRRYENHFTIVIVVLFVILALGFSSGPIFEGPDEQGHYGYIEYLLRNRTLPDAAEDIPAQWLHAPLYYMMATPVMAAAGAVTASHNEGALNPYIYSHGADAFAIPGNDNKNFCLHSRAEAFPYTESIVARRVHLIRLLSIAFGTGTVLASAAIFRVLWPTSPERRLAATDSEDREVTPFVGQIVINGAPQPFEPDYHFGDVIGLARPEFRHNSSSLAVCLRWGSLATTSTDYHIFVHVLSESGDLIAQADSQPKNGLYPTNVWTVGEVIEDCVTLDTGPLPDKWRVAIGLYELPSGDRLPVVNRDGHLLDNGMVVFTP